jgi:hypothetical protein
MARGQQLLACALQRAEAAEMELAALKLDGSSGSGKGASSSRRLLASDAAEGLHGNCGLRMLAV